MDPPINFSKTILDTEEFKKVVQRFEELLKEEGNVAQMTRSFLEMRRKSGETFLWGELANTLKLK